MNKRVLVISSGTQVIDNWSDTLKKFIVAPSNRRAKVTTKNSDLEAKARVLCSLHACASMAEARRLVQAGGLEKALRKAGVRLRPGVPMAFDTSNFIEDEELIELATQICEEDSSE